MNRARLAPAAVALGAFALYALTCAREPIFGDGLEFVAAAAARGIPHPTGYPLFTMVLAAVGSSSYFAATLVCAAFAAVGVLLVFLLARGAQRVAWASRPSGLEASDGLGCALFCAALWAASASVWRSATAVEVYGLNAMLVLAIIAFATGEPSPRRAALACFAQGLALCNHLSSVAMAPLVLLCLMRAAHAQTSGRRATTVLAEGVASGVAGLLPWLWLPLRARANPAVNWGDPETLDGFLWIARGGDYAQTQFLMAAPGQHFSLGGWIAFAASRLLLLLRSAGAESLGGVGFDDSIGRIAAQFLFGGLLLAATVAGARAWWRRDRTATLALGAAAAFQLFMILTYNIRDIEDYFLGLWATLLPFALGGAVSVAAWMRAKGAVAPRLPALVGVLVPAFAVLANFGAASRAGDRIARSWIDRACDALPENAILVTQADYDAYGMWYAQQVEDRRPDVLVVGANFLRYGWYATMLPEADTLGRVAVAKDRAVPRSADEHVRALDEAAIAPNLGRAPVVITNGDPIVLELLARKYRLEPAAPLLSEGELELAAERLPVLPPYALYRIAPPAAPEPPRP